MTVAFGLSVLAIFLVGFSVFHCGLPFFHAESNITGVLNVQGCVSGKTVLYSIQFMEWVLVRLANILELCD